MSAALPRRGFLALAAGLGLTGCGFQPVYMPATSGAASAASRDLAAVNVPVIPDRPGQLLRQALQERLANDNGTPHRYDLQLSFAVTGEGIAILQSNFATRVRLRGTANWTLIAQNPAKTRLTSGSAHTLDGFNILDQQYFASDLENEAVQKRIAENLADQIAMQLALYFRKHPSAG
ncbi:MAG TPA: LPS assembly lipoprotein LptE [Acetobacteraceae bacterium]|jgi:LPS-assembly lipoprotein